MKNIFKYSEFINEEWSKNEPVPEIIGKDKGLALFLIGAPGIGKSTMVNNYIHTKNLNIKDFSTDDISLLFTKDPNVYYPNASKLNLKKMKMFIKTGNSFIYDTTGAGAMNSDTGFEHVKDIFDLARENNYEIVFIHLLSTLQTSIEQDKLRSRHVDPKYIEWAYVKQLGGEFNGEIVKGNMQRFKELNPDEYYVIYSIDKRYKFLKYINGKLCKRKNDKYVPIN